MDEKLRKIIKRNRDALVKSEKRFADIYEIMFSWKDSVLCETSDGFRVKKQTYGEMENRIKSAAAALYEKVGATHAYIALELDNSPEWIVAFWAILMSGNRPYLVNLRYPASLSNGIFETLGIKYTVCKDVSELNAESIPVSELVGEGAPPRDVFENEIAFSSSATSMNEVVCFYTGAEVSEQIMNFETIVKLEPRIAKHYKGELKQLAFLPFYHVFGLFAVYFWFAFFARTIVFLRNYSADTILKTCRKHNVTHIFAVPVLWHTIEKSVIATAKEKGEYEKLQKAMKLTSFLQNMFPSFGPELSKKIMGKVTREIFGESVMFCINGGSYVKDSALELLNGIGYNTYNGYGMSEIGITSVELRRKMKHRCENSIGRPFDSVEYKISDDGVLLVRGSSLCTRKLVNGKEQVFDGWFNTGDKMVEREGNYFILGRESDIVLGENGENINPDMIEKLLDIKDAKALSVLGLRGEDGDELSLVAEVSEFVSDETLRTIREAVYAINDTLPRATSIKKFYFTTDALCPPTAIKVSRAQLIRKIENGEVKLISFADMKGEAKDGGESRLARDVRVVIAEILGISAEDIGVDTHIFYDLGATSIQYFSILSRLSEKFSVSDYKQNDKFCYTVRDICEYLEKHI